MISTDVIEKLEFSKVLSVISSYAVTEKGKLNILSILPSVQIDHIIHEGNLVSEAKNILIKSDIPPLEYLPDISESLFQSRIDGVVLSSKKILYILKLAEISRSIFYYIKRNSESQTELSKKCEYLFNDKIFEHQIKKIVNENGDVNANASSKLLEIRNEINSKNEELKKLVNRIIKNLTKDDIVREEYLTLRDGRIVVPVKVEHKRHLKGFIHSGSASGQTVYIEPEETLELNNDIVSLAFAEKREIERLLKELTKFIGQHAAELSKSFELISEIDTIFARAKYSIEIIGSFPDIKSEKPFTITGGRHPLLLKRLSRDKCTPLNLFHSNNIILITGPNAGGKTVVLKTVGLLCLMVQSGIHIPASPDSVFNIFTNILIDIGDQQSIEDDLSTYTSHLKNLKQIVDTADDHSLVLLDEIGTGTDPSAGAAIAAEVLIRLNEVRAKVLATTHHGSLKLIASETSGFENAAMEFDSSTLTPTYNFKQGIPGSSYAFEIASRIGFDNSFIHSAERFIDTEQNKIEKFLVDIETKSHKLDKELKLIENEKMLLEELIAKYKNENDLLQNEKKNILKTAKAEAAEYISGINKIVESEIKRLRESNAEHESIKQVKKEIKQIFQRNEELIKEEIEVKVDSEIMIGNFVQIRNTNTTGKVIEIDDQKKQAHVEVGKTKMKIGLSELLPIKKPEPEKELHDYPIISSKANTRLDIRGKKPDEIGFELLKFIDDAYTINLSQVEILHGKGTGALKKVVNEILREHSKVKSFYFAPVEFGGEGITIVEIK